MSRKITIMAALLLAALPLQGAVRLTAVRPAPGRDNGTAVIVCPGGSYHWLDRRTEGFDVADSLAAHGFTAFVLEYRHAGTRYLLAGPLAFPQHHYREILSDLGDALESVEAEGFGRIGVAGFSAGGHLALMSGMRHLGLVGKLSRRPDFIISVYPVVTMAREEIVHRRSRRALLGRYKGTPYVRDLFSLEDRIPQAGMPPVFLVNCKDDPVVDWHNSEKMDSALSARGISHQWLLYDEGGHGFGAGSAKAPWLPEFITWYNSIFSE